MSNELTVGGDGFDVQEPHGGNLIRGKLIKYQPDRDCYLVDKVNRMPDVDLIVADILTVWVRWENRKPVEPRIRYPGKRHPDRDELGYLDESSWEDGLNGPSDPWRDSRYCYLVNPQNGAEYTLSTDTFGGLRAIGDLKRQVSNARHGQPGALPVVRLGSVDFATKYGTKKRPHLEVVGWSSRTGGVTHVVAPPRQEQLPPPNTSKPTPAVSNDGPKFTVGPFSSPSDDMDDSVPF